MNLLMKGAALAPPFSCTTKYSSDVYSPRPPDIRVRLLPTKPPVHFTTEQPGRDNILDTLPFQTGAGGRWLCVLFAQCSEWNFGEYYFQENFEDFKKAQSKKVVIPKNTVSCNSRCFWVSRRLVSFLESSEQISRFGAAFKKPPPKRRFLVHQQGLEPGTR